MGTEQNGYLFAVIRLAGEPGSQPPVLVSTWGRCATLPVDLIGARGLDRALADMKQRLKLPIDASVTRLIEAVDGKAYVVDAELPMWKSLPLISTFGFLPSGHEWLDPYSLLSTAQDANHKSFLKLLLRMEDTGDGN